MTGDLVPDRQQYSPILLGLPGDQRFAGHAGLQNPSLVRPREMILGYGKCDERPESGLWGTPSLLLSASLCFSDSFTALHVTSKTHDIARHRQQLPYSDWVWRMGVETAPISRDQISANKYRKKLIFPDQLNTSRISNHTG